MDPKSTKQAGLALLVFVLVIGCGLALYKKSQKNNIGPSWASHDAELASLQQKTKDLAGQIQKSSGDLKCKESFQCHNVGLGPKTCGGYNSFLVYSSYDSDESELLSLVREFNQISERHNNLSMKVPPCGKNPAEVRCVHSQCQPVEP